MPALPHGLNLNARAVAAALGGEAHGNRVLAPGPGHSKHDRSLSVAVDPDAPGGFVVHSFAGDDWRECRDYVRERLGLADFTPAGPRPSPIIAAPPQDRARVERAGILWGEARPIEGTPAEAYLASRGLSYQGEALRWHPSCPFGKGERHGCMIGLVRNIVTDEPQAIHRTAIDANGRKIDRKAYGPIGGGAVKLTHNADVTTVIAIGEGHRNGSFHPRAARPGQHAGVERAERRRHFRLPCPARHRKRVDRGRQRCLRDRPESGASGSGASRRGGHRNHHSRIDPGRCRPQ